MDDLQNFAEIVIKNMHEDLLASTKYLRLDDPKISLIQGAISQDLYLSSYGKIVSKRYLNEAGHCLGGGVIQSKQLENLGKSTPSGKAIYDGQRRALAKKKARDALQAARELQSEWFALEYALVLTVPMCDFHLPIRWDRITSINVSKSGFMSKDLAITLKYLENGIASKELQFQSNAQGAQALIAIANQCGVSTSI